MLRLPRAMRVNTVGNIMHRTSYITGKIMEVGSNNRYSVDISGSGKPYPKIFVNDPNIVYEVGDTVGIGWEDGNREKPIIIGILRNITEIKVVVGVNALGV